MIILDSNIWVALFNEKDSQNSKAEKLYDETREEILIPEYVILETVSIISLKVSKKRADGFLEYALNNRNISILYSDKGFFENVVKFYRKTFGSQLSFVDIALLYLSDFYKIKTFDKRLNRAIKRRKPLREFFEFRKTVKTRMSTEDIIKAIHKGRLTYDSKKGKIKREGV